MIIDTHEHIGTDDPAFLAVLEEHNLFVLNMCFAESAGESWHAQAECYRALSDRHPERFGWCTAFSLPEPGAFSSHAAGSEYCAAVIDRLKIDFADGAAGCKIWKNIGMEVVDQTGGYVMVDHPIFTPIFDFLTAANRPVVAHLGEPLACWLPLDEASPHYGYYSAHPEWHMYGRDGMPSHAQIISARDQFLERHPNLVVVGAHLGSLEHDVTEVARRLDLYPNFCVDIAARLGDLMIQDQNTVREFFLNYHDRILFGTDLFVDASQLQNQDSVPDLAESARMHLSDYLAYLRSAGSVTIGSVTASGLDLPPHVLESLFGGNARRIFRGLPVLPP